jgi:hypothetical protein
MKQSLDIRINLAFDHIFDQLLNAHTMCRRLQLAKRDRGLRILKGEIKPNPIKKRIFS